MKYSQHQLSRTVEVALTPAALLLSSTADADRDLLTHGAGGRRGLRRGPLVREAPPIVLRRGRPNHALNAVIVNVEKAFKPVHSGGGQTTRRPFTLRPSMHALAQISSTPPLSVCT
jgi:hypothetical protein